MVTVDFVGSDHNTVTLSHEAYQIVSWRDTEVIATSEAPCRRHMLTLDSATQDVKLISRDKEGCGKDSLMAMSSVLVDGLLGEEFRAVMDSVYKDRTMYRSLVISNTEFPSSIAH